MGFDPLAIGTIEDDADLTIQLVHESSDSDQDEPASHVRGSHLKGTVNFVASLEGLSKEDRKAARKLAKKQRMEQKAARLSARKADEKKKEEKQRITAALPEEEPDAMDVNPDFNFEVDGGALDKVGPQNAWDFTSAKATIKAQYAVNGVVEMATTIDDKINKRRNVDTVAPESSAADESDLSQQDIDDEVDGENGVDSDGEDDGEDESETLEMQPKNDDEDDEEDIADTVQEKRKAAYFAAAPEVVDTETVASFTDMRLSRQILKGVAELGFVKPTVIQARGIPIALQGQDICASAMTGSGKTAAFIIPVLERLLYRPKNNPTTRVLVLVPTRELGVQCHSVAVNLAKFTDIQICLCVGGLSTKLQEAELRKRPDIVIATPGRLIDHIHNSPSFHLDSIEILIIDEADRILEDGFADELAEIIKATPKNRQTMLFSATMTDNVDDLVKLSLTRPVRLFVNKVSAIASKLVQEFIRVRNTKEESRPAILVALCSRTYSEETIVFFRSKAAAHHMKVVFGLLGLSAAELHGNLTQLQRLEALEQFRDKKVKFLLATDLASRGLDISGIKTVINYDMPKSYAQYVHRVGRTARGDKGGRAVSLVGEADRKILKLAVRSSTDEIKHRVIPPMVIARMERRLKDIEGAVKDIFEEERVERELRGAEMNVRKLENVMKHEAEIKSRPARSWFQSGAERQAAKELGRKKHMSDFGLKDSKAATDASKPKRGKFDGLSRKKKRNLLAREEDKGALIAQKVAAKSAKRLARSGTSAKTSRSNSSKRSGKWPRKSVKGGGISKR